MERPNRSPFESNRSRRGRSPLAFHFRRKAQAEGSSSSPFTEIPEELKDSRFSFGRLLRNTVNALLLLVLGLALLALIAAFAYQLIFQPEALAEMSYSIISSLESFISSLTAAP